MSLHHDLFIRAAASAPSPDNAQHWTFHVEQDAVTVKHRRGSAIDPFGPAGHATLMGVGAMHENVRQAAQALGGESPEWRPDPTDLDSGYFTFPLAHETWEGHEELPLFQRHTNRFAFHERALPEVLIDELRKTTGHARLQCVSDSAGLSLLGNVARVCCEARFCDRELHEWLMSSIRFDEREAAVGDGIDIATIALPPGGAQFMRFIRPWGRMAALNRLFAYKLMAQQEVMKMLNASALLCLVGESTPHGALAAGVLMERVWIALNAAGWGVHPYYVIADQQSRQNDGRGVPERRSDIAAALARLNAYLDLSNGERLHMVLRVGWPKRPNPDRSRRLPIADLIQVA